MTSAKLRARWTSEHDAEFQARASKRQPGSGKYEGWRQDELVERFGEFEGRADVRGLTLSLLRNVRWSNVDLSYAKLTRSMSNVSLERCLARGIAMLADEISGTLVDSDLREAKIERVHLLAGVTRCSFDGARFQRTTIATTFRATTSDQSTGEGCSRLCLVMRWRSSRSRTMRVS